jgi:hypothetical protein
VTIKHVDRRATDQVRQEEWDYVRVPIQLVDDATFTLKDEKQKQPTEGTYRAEILIGLRKNGWGSKPYLVATDAKVQLNALHEFYGEVARYRDGFKRVYLATTGWTGIEEGIDNLHMDLKEHGVGLVRYGVIGTSKLVRESHPPH